MKFKKGDRVKFSTGSKTCYGVVSKGGAGKITVVLDGAKKQVRSIASCFQPSVKPLPNADELNVMAAYTVAGYKEINGHGDSTSFAANVYRNGKKITAVTNCGWGGCNHYTPARSSVCAFFADAATWAENATGSTIPEAADLWLFWEVFQRPYGMTAKTSLAEIAGCVN